MGGLDPPIQSNKYRRLRPWMAGSEAGHGEVWKVASIKVKTALTFGGQAFATNPRALSIAARSRPSTMLRMVPLPRFAGEE